MAEQNEHPVDIQELLEDREVVERALRKAVQDELRIHKAMGNPVPEWRDGKVVWIPPEEIPLDDEPAG